MLCPACVPVLVIVTDTSSESSRVAGGAQHRTADRPQVVSVSSPRRAVRLERQLDSAREGGVGRARHTRNR
jgi:hypothetical protein